MKFFLRTTVPVLTLGLLVGCFALGSAPAGADGEASLEARTAKILANLKLQFPQLDKLNPTMGSLEASDFEGLDKGTFVVRGQNQVFLVSNDDTQLFLIQGEPIDVSRSAEAIAAEVKKREEAEAAEAQARKKQLDEAIAGRPLRGNPDAPVTLVEFSDFQCPYCTRGAATVEQILEKYPTHVK
ncbi:MAG: thioredoxin domain-containing protein, partial [Acidobacteriota bacterium]